jgi:hypothetical protein
VAHSFFMKKIERMGVRMEILLGGLLAAVFRDPPAALKTEGHAALPRATGAPQAAQAPEQAPPIFTAVPDPGANTYPGGQPPVMVADEIPNYEDELAPAPDAAGELPRLLAGHRPDVATPTAPEEPGSATGAEQPSRS